MTPQPLSTFERSCQHWSERGRAEMDAFYKLASKDYRLLATHVSWAEVFTKLRAKFGDQLRLLDVACGSGQFPTALREHGGLDPTAPVCAGLSVDYSLLDPAQFSIDTAKSKLQPPFVAAEELLCTAQELKTPHELASAELYHVVWATHALYCVPPAELDLAVQRMIAALDPQGLAFIAHAKKSSHYLRFQELYLQSSFAGSANPYCSGEQVLAALRARLDPTKLFHFEIEYEGTIALADTETAERYLQRCLFDDDLTLDAMLADPSLGAYLNGCMDRQADQWRFPQRTCLIFYGDFVDVAQTCITSGVGIAGPTWQR